MYLPIKTVGVVGDERRYADVIALQAVETVDFMTAKWANLPYEFISKVSNRIVNEIADISRVVYDVTGKPPATIGGSNDAYAKISTYLAADLETVKSYLMTPALLNCIGGWLNEIPSYRTKFFSVKMG